MNVNKQEIKGLADRVKTDRRFCTDQHHHVLAEGVQALLAENDMLAAQRLMHARLNLSLRARRKVWVAACEKAEDELLDALAERDQLKAENEALREEVGGLKEVSSVQVSALKVLIFAARTTGGTAGPDEALMKACEEAERSISLGGIGRAYMSGADAAMAKEVSHDC